MLTALAMLPLGTMVTRLSPVMTISSSSESDSEIIRLEVCASEGGDGASYNHFQINSLKSTYFSAQSPGRPAPASCTWSSVTWLLRWTRRTISRWTSKP